MSAKPRSFYTIPSQVVCDVCGHLFGSHAADTLDRKEAWCCDCPDGICAK